MKDPRNRRQNSVTPAAMIAGGSAVLIGSFVIFRFLRAVLQEQFLLFLWGLLAIAIASNIVFLILRRWRPDLLAQIRSRIERDQQAQRRSYSPTARSLFILAGIIFAAVAAAGVWFIWNAPDFALFILLWVVPSTYLAMTALYAGITGKKDHADGSVFWWLWPW